MAAIRKRTRDLILEVFETQLKTMPFEDIRVSAICQDCGIERPHFYYYFKDKYDLSCCYFIESQRKAVEAGLASQASFKELLSIAFNTVADNKSIYQRLMRYRGSNSMFYKLSEFTHDYTQYLLKHWNRNITLSEKEAEQLKFYCYAFTGILLTWYMEDIATPPEYLIRLTYDNIPTDLKKYFP